MEFTSGDYSPGKYGGKSLIPGYNITRRLGAGATGTVLLAETLDGADHVAVKIVHPHLCQKDKVNALFLATQERIKGLDVEGILPVLDSGQLDSGELFVISELAQGRAMTDVLVERAPLELEEAVPMLDAVAEVLEGAHGKAVLHGNLSPENIWVCEEKYSLGRPEVWLLDFGMSILHRPTGPDQETRPPYYLSPEQVRGEPPNESTDVYAFGVITFKMLTGRLPFSSPVPSKVLLMHLSEDPPPPGEVVPMIPEAELFLFQALSKDPNYRFDTMAKTRSSLRRLVSKEFVQRLPAFIDEPTPMTREEALEPADNQDSSDGDFSVVVQDTSQPDGEALVDEEHGPPEHRGGLVLLQTAPGLGPRQSPSTEIDLSELEEDDEDPSTTGSTMELASEPQTSQGGNRTEVSGAIERASLRPSHAKPQVPRDSVIIDSDALAVKLRAQAPATETSQPLPVPRKKPPKPPTPAADPATGVMRKPEVVQVNNLGTYFSGFLGILSAIGLGVASYRLITGFWPLP